jgi:hypothetical protein
MLAWLFFHFMAKPDSPPLGKVKHMRILQAHMVGPLCRSSACHAHLDSKGVTLAPRPDESSSCMLVKLRHHSHLLVV